MLSLSRSQLVLLLILWLASVARADEKQGAADPWSKSFEPPQQITSDRVRLEPLNPSHTARDFKAVMSSRDHLRKTLQWGGWPQDDMSEEDNRAALENHWSEFKNHEAYAYTVLTPDGEACLGCVYLYPVSSNKNALSAIYWVVQTQLSHDLDRHLVKLLIANFEEAWPVEMVEFSVPLENERGISLLKEIGLVMRNESSEQVTYAWLQSE